MGQGSFSARCTGLLRPFLKCACTLSKYSRSRVASSVTPFKLSLFRSEFNTFNNNGAQMLDSSIVFLV